MKYVEVKKADLIHNIKIIKKINEETKEPNKPRIIAVVKGNAYGTGIVECSRVLIEQGIDLLAVATVEEALVLRKNNIEVEILMLSSTTNKEEVRTLIDNNITLTVGSEEAILLANRIARSLNKNINVHVKVDTGFGRYGFLEFETKVSISALKKAKNLKVVGMYSHFSESFAKNSEWTNSQYKSFLDIVEKFVTKDIEPGMLHICNTSAFFKYPEMRLDAVRIGSAFSGKLIIPNIYGLKKVGFLKSEVAQIKILPKGFELGYSRTFKIKKKTKVAVIPIGYGEGAIKTTENDSFRIVDHIRYMYNDFKNIFKKNRHTVKINDRKYNVIGKVGMNYMIVDIGLDNVKIGDDVYTDAKILHVDSNIRRVYI